MADPHFSEPTSFCPSPPPVLQTLLERGADRAAAEVAAWMLQTEPLTTTRTAGAPFDLLLHDVDAERFELLQRPACEVPAGDGPSCGSGAGEGADRR